MPLSLLPLDILLIVFRDLDVVDVVRVGMTCRDLYHAAQDRHVWVDHLDNLRQKNPVLKPATPPLTSLSAQELKGFIAGWINLRFRWEKDHTNFGFTKKGVVGIPGPCCLFLLPGGKTLLTIDDRGGLALRRIEMVDGRVSLPSVATIESDKVLVFKPGRNKLITTTSPSPILVRGHGSNVQILKIDHHNGTMTLETTFHLSEGSVFISADGQGRTIGLLVKKPFGRLGMIIIHLDHLNATLESDIPPPDTRSPRLFRSLVTNIYNISIPTESLAVLYYPEDILTCKIPDFSSLSPGRNLMTATPVPIVRPMDWISISHMASEPIYDPLSARRLDLYYLHKGNSSRVILITIPLESGVSLRREGLRTIRDDANGPITLPLHKGFHLKFEKTCDNKGAYFVVMTLKNLSTHDPRIFLRVFVSDEEFEQVSQASEIDMDEATGRMIIWGWDEGAEETKVFVGDLV